MKKYLLILSLALAQSLPSNAQSSDYKVVFDLTSRDSVNQQSVVREIGLIKGENPGASLKSCSTDRGWIW